MAAVQKSRDQRLEELRQSMVVIRRNLEIALTEHEFALFLPVTGQLRSLLVETNTNHPLLLELADELDVTLEFYSIPLDFLELQAPILGPKSIQWTGDSIRAMPEGPPFNQKVTIDEWLASTQVIAYGKRITGKQLIRLSANKSGGSHFDPTMPTELAEMKLFEIGGLPSQYMTLVRLGEIACLLSEQVLAAAAKHRP